MFGGSFPNPNPGNGFHQQQLQQQQQQQQQQQGSASNPFGSFGGGGNPNNPSMMSGFGTSSNLLSTPSTPANHGSNMNMQMNTNSNQMSFGAGSTMGSSPFGQPSQMGNFTVESGFGMSATTTSSNMNATNVTAPSTFGTSDTMAMGKSASAAAMASPFGVSSNNITNLDMNSGTNTDMNSGLNMSTANNSSSAFGQSTNVFSSPFGNSTNTTTTGFDTSANDTNTNISGFGHSTSTNINEINTNLEWVNPNSKKNQTVPAASAEADKSQELAKLKAKLEEKKKKIMEMKLKAQAQSQSLAQSQSQSQPRPQRQAQTQAEVQPQTQPKAEVQSLPHSKDSNKGKDRKKGMKKDKPVADKRSLADGNASLAARNEKRFAQNTAKDKPAADKRPLADGNASLAAKNEKRFAQNTANRNTFAILPKDLHQHARDYDPSQGEDASNNEIDDNGGSSSDGNLVGTCIHMCPDEELIRRESENGIQTLELPCKVIHPPSWTLRETAVKRFRRSAADFKLDIPELVRPPHVLERVCGYLEEWVMERDRQGLDPRFGNDSGNGFGLGNGNANRNVQVGTVPPLDVYQFIWDRTRMVRKDFILQNFIGTGGRCNAIAVRCHERIARWHALCEHQLSHLPDFISMQSQQNIQELGATMKSLNMFYDDAEGRSILEDSADSSDNPDAGVVHGCQYSAVKGNNPVDYDNKPLMNAAETMNVSNRIVGNSNTVSGTAEPEMRGLYILLTINNDGGMEVLKYAARLSRDRPNIFNSKPVQMALQVYKAKREYNYAKFFSLLRSPSTPYLSACIMFKYVETMRKAAFRIMSKTFGAKRKDSGEGVYDQYPLSDLVHLLAFEDLDEAKEACRHYNITVKGIPLVDGSNDHIDIIFWRAGKGFKERRDPEKGTILPLTPRKMIRTIESKLGGATRLAICRGEVSGVGATLNASNSPEDSKLLEERTKKREENKLKRQQAIEQAKRYETQQKEALQKKNEAILREQTIELARQQEAERKEEESKRKLDEEKVRLKHEGEEIIRKEQEAESERQRLEQMKRRHQEEIEKQRREQEAEAEHRRLEQIEKKRQLELEEQRRQQEAEAERQRLERIEKERQEKLERDRREKAAEAERLRLNRIEKERQEQLERQRLQEEAERRRIELDWQSKIAHARKLVAMKIWSASLSAICGKRERTKSSIESFDPLSTRNSNTIQDRITGHREQAELQQLQMIEELELQKKARDEIIENRAVELDWQKEPPCTRTSIESFDPLSTMNYSPVRYEMEFDDEQTGYQPAHKIETNTKEELDYNEKVEAQEQNDDIGREEQESEEEATGAQIILKEFDPNNYIISPKQLPFSNKRQMDIIDDDSFYRKRSKQHVSKQRKGISEDLQKSKNFTMNLKALKDTAGIGRVLNDPVLAKLIESDEHLKQLTRMYS